MSTYDPEQTGNYYVLGDSHAEMVQLIETDRYFTRSMGGLLPEQTEQALSGIHDVLDVACGPGGWVLGMAQAFPDMQVTGLDISESMIGYATVLARASQIDNISFRVGNAIEPLDFPDNSFDLVNARQIEGVIPTASWPILLKEMFRISRPGGIIRLTGNEWGVSNSQALEEIQEIILRGYMAFGLNHGVDCRNYAITTMISRYLHDAGCVHIQERPSLLDFSAGAEQQQDIYKMWMIALELAEPFLLSAGAISSPAEYEQIKRNLSLKMTDDSLRGIIYTLTAWGQKPEKL